MRRLSLCLNCVLFVRPASVSLYEKCHLTFTKSFYYTVCTFFEPKSSLVRKINYFEYLL